MQDRESRVARSLSGGRAKFPLYSFDAFRILNPFLAEATTGTEISHQANWDSKPAGPDPVCCRAFNGSCDSDNIAGLTLRAFPGVLHEVRSSLIYPMILCEIPP